VDYFERKHWENSPCDTVHLLRLKLSHGVYRSTV